MDGDVQSDDGQQPGQGGDASGSAERSRAGTGRAFAHAARITEAPLDEARPGPPWAASDRAAGGLIFGLALCVEVLAAWLGVRGAPISLSALAVFFDGHKYLEIAKSFPLPYSAQGDLLLGHAPGYPALIALLHAVAGGALDWGSAALLASWVCGALAALAFYVLCRQLGLPALLPSLLFVLANPRWLALASTAHPEPLAVLAALVSAIAWRRRAYAWAALGLGLTVLTRFPSLVVVLPLAAGFWLQRRPPPPRAALALAAPFLALLLHDLYLGLRVPGFQGIRASHAFWWEPRWSLPFLGLLRHPDAFPPALPLAALTYASAALYSGAAALGFARRDRCWWIGSLWIAVVTLLAASPEDPVGVRAFTRLAILAWPAALLVLTGWVASRRPRLPARAWGPVLLLLALLSLGFAARQSQLAISGQLREQRFLRDTIERLDSDAPVWVDFRRERRERRRR